MEFQRLTEDGFQPLRSFCHNAGCVVHLESRVGKGYGPVWKQGSVGFLPGLTVEVDVFNRCVPALLFSSVIDVPKNDSPLKNLLEVCYAANLCAHLMDLLLPLLDFLPRCRVSPSRLAGSVSLLG